MRTVLLLGCVLVAATAAQASPPRNGLYGTVTRGPISPICVAEQPCSGPAQGVVLQFWLGGRVAGRSTVRADGTYRVALPVGSYAVKTGSGVRLDPPAATVRRLRFKRVDFFIDTGIR